MGSFINLVGKQIGSLLVICRTTLNKKISWICKCSCGDLVTLEGYKLLKSRNLECFSCRKPNFERITIQEKFFDQINSEESAYYLGLIFADGHINVKKNSFSIQLQSQDSYILKNLSMILYNKDYVNYGKYPKFCVVNKHIVTQLQKYGLKQNKTFDLDYPAQLKGNKYEPDFIRGFMDGDGCICIPKSNRASPTYFAIGTESMMSGIGNYFKDKFNLNVYFSSRLLAKSQKLLYQFKIKNYQNCTIALNHVYDNSTIYLTRKYDKYQQIIKRFKEIGGREVYAKQRVR